MVTVMGEDELQMDERKRKPSSMSQFNGTVSAAERAHPSDCPNEHAYGGCLLNTSVFIGLHKSCSTHLHHERIASTQPAGENVSPSRQDS